MNGASDPCRLYGTAVPADPFRMLRAGLLTARLEAGNLRHIHYGDTEIIRAISYVVRDRDWGTLAPVIRDLSVLEDNERFSVSYRGECQGPGAILVYCAKIEGDANARLSFSVEAMPDGDFETNRCGFTVLHPIGGVSGEAVRVEHCDGVIEAAAFPHLIEPWQPFKDIRALTHFPEGLSVDCRMEGDAFEMEDQRNWSDASYKTYVRPLARPWPYVMPAGIADRQSVTLSVRAARNASSPAPPCDDSLAGDLRMPKIGLVIAPEEACEALAAIDTLRAVAPQVILCHFDRTAGHGQDALDAFAALQRAYPADYELECILAANGDLDEELGGVAAIVRAAGLTLDAVFVCPSVDRQSTPPGSRWPACPPLADIYSAARRAFPHVTLGGGMASYFTELNRKRPPLDLIDFVTHGTAPIVHAADDISVMETLEALAHITRSVRAFAGRDMDYRLGPTTIAMRQNPYGSRTMDNPDGERICMAHDDPRQRGLFAAAWTAGYAAAIADAGITRWVPAAFTGPRGILAAQGGLLPIGEVIATLAGLSGKRLTARSLDRRRATLSFKADDGPAVLLANLTAAPIDIDEPTCRLGAFAVRLISP